MNLDDAQRKTVTEWIAAGLKLSEIQSRLAAELGIRMTYMEVRLLVDDLKLVPKDMERPAVPPDFGAERGSQASRPPADATEAADTHSAEAKANPGTGSVSVSVDQIARPGAVASGKVSFPDGNKAEWYFDQTGRLGMVPEQPGYRPPAADLRQFQVALEAELSKMGF